MVDWKSHVVPQLLALVPFLIGVTEVVKGWLFSDKALELKAKGQEGTARRIAYRILPGKGRLPVFVWALSFVLASVYGFVVSQYEGWRMVVNAVLQVGFVQGSIVGFASMGVFDAVLKGRS
jgi:hypothetical protein